MTIGYELNVNSNLLILDRSIILRFAARSSSRREDATLYKRKENSKHSSKTIWEKEIHSWTFWKTFHDFSM